MIPDKTNFFAALKTEKTKDQIAKLYNWRTTNDLESTEIFSDWAELVIEPAKGKILIHGPVADVEKNIKFVLMPLREAKVSFTAEGYGPDDELIVSEKSE